MWSVLGHLGGRGRAGGVKGLWGARGGIRHAVRSLKHSLHIVAHGLGSSYCCRASVGLHQVCQARSPKYSLRSLALVRGKGKVQPGVFAPRWLDKLGPSLDLLSLC